MLQTVTVSETPARPTTLSLPLENEDLIRRHQRAVWRYLRFLGADGALAEDLTQETFLALLRSPPRQSEDRAVSAWLRSTAYRLFCNSRRRPREATLELSEAEAAWQTFVRDGDGDEAMEALARCMEALPDEMRRALRLRYDGKGSRKAVAAALALTLDGAKTLLRRARQRLSNCMEWRMSR